MSYTLRLETNASNAGFVTSTLYSPKLLKAKNGPASLSHTTYPASGQLIFGPRWESLVPIFVFTIMKTVFMIPKFHIKAHQELNHQQFSFDYQPGVGQTHAETVEEGWASLNKAALQTKEMSATSQALMLDDIFGFFN